MSEEYRQDASGTMIYPKRGTMHRLFYRIPMLLWRMGLGPYFSHESRGGSRMLALTTWGRKSRLPRHTMLTCGTVEDQIFVCSGWGKRSDWVRNLSADPQVTLQLGSKTMSMKARRVTEPDEFKQIVDEMFETGGDSHFEPWLASYGIELDPQDMMEKHQRLHLITFDPSGQSGPPGMRTDLKWVWGALAALLVLLAAWLLLS